VSDPAIHSLVRTVRGINKRLREEILPAIERSHESARKLPPNSLHSHGAELILEAEVRTYLLDPILNALGWKTSTIERVLVEAPAEAISSSQNRRYLDYHGHEVSSNNTVTSLLIIEAKRLSVELPFGNAHPDQIPSLLIQAISANQSEESISQSTNTTATDRLVKPLDVGVFWKSILDTAKDYVARVSASDTGAPKQFTLTNGEWFVVFRKPLETFIHNSSDSKDVLVFLNLDDVASRADEFFACLSYSALSEKIPTQFPANLPKFFLVDDYPLEVCLTVELATSILDVQPVFGMNIVAQVRKSDGVWIQFKEDNQADGLVVIKHNSEDINTSLAALEGRGNKLIEALKRIAPGPFRLVTALEYEISRRQFAVKHNFGYNDLLVEAGRGLYLLHIGSRSSPFITNTAFDDCSYHAWGPCKDDQNMGVGNGALAGQSLDPAAYFPSGSSFHCAHKVVHQKRQSLCPINSVEQFLCCRKCALQERCWPNGFEGFPCQANIAA